MIENITPPPALTAIATTVTTVLYTGSLHEEPSATQLAFGLESGLLIPFTAEGFAHALAEAFGTEFAQRPAHPAVTDLAERLGCLPSAQALRDVMDMALAHTKAHLLKLRATTPATIVAASKPISATPPSFADMLATVDRNIEVVLGRGVA